MVLVACRAHEDPIERGVLTLEWEYQLFQVCGKPGFTQTDGTIDPRHWERAQVVLDEKGVCTSPVSECPMRRVYLEARTRRETQGLVALTEILGARLEPPADCTLPSVVVPPPNTSLERSRDG